MTQPTHLSPAPEGAELAGWHPVEDCFAVLMPDGTARLYIDGRQVDDAAPLHTVADLARMDHAEYLAVVARIKSGAINLGSKHGNT
jgi:hypothetical protein